MSIDLRDEAVSVAERREAVREAARAVAQRFDRAYILSCIEAGRQPVELNRALGESGLLGIGLAEEYGGSGGGLVEQVALVETLARHGIQASSPAQEAFIRHLILEHGTDVQRKEFIPKTLTGEQFSCFALTESDAGTNAFAIRTSATRDGDTWVINGHKVFISGAGEASRMVLVARTSEASSDQRTAGLSMFLFDLPADGVTMTRMATTANLPHHQYNVYFDDVRIPADALVGEVDQAVRCVFSGLNPERVIVGAMALGLGYHLLERGTAYAQTRAPFGQPIGSYQSVQHMLARAHVSLEAARLMTYEAARLHDAGAASGASAVAAKYLASEAAGEAVDAVIQVYGGSAFDHDTDILRHYEFIRLSKIAPLNNQMALNIIGERVLNLPRSY